MTIRWFRYKDSKSGFVYGLDFLDDEWCKAGYTVFYGKTIVKWDPSVLSLDGSDQFSLRSARLIIGSASEISDKEEVSKYNRIFAAWKI